jgi:hypothetical protein
MIHIQRLSYGAVPHYSPWQFPLFLESLSLTWNPSSCVVRSHPPWPQVARKLTSPSPFQFPDPPGFPKSTVRPTKTTSRSRLYIVRNNTHPWYRYNIYCVCLIKKRRLSLQVKNKPSVRIRYMRLILVQRSTWLRTYGPGKPVLHNFLVSFPHSFFLTFETSAGYFIYTKLNSGMNSAKLIAKL